MWSAAMLLVLFAYLPVMAQDEAGAAQRAEDAQKADSRMSGAESETPSAPSATVIVNGGPIKKVLAVTKNTQQTTKSTAFVAVTGATRTVAVPAGTQDTVVVTFSAECELLPSANDGNDWVAVDIRDNGVSIVGNGDTSFCGGEDYNQNSIQAVRRLGAGNHTISVFFKTTKATKEAWLDDWALTILQSD
jgi:hypothetical protein